MTEAASEEFGQEADRRGAFPVLTDDEQATLAAVGRTRAYAAGVLLFAPGVKRVASAVSEGSQVVSMVHTHLTSRFARL